jgi:hypothetical protein
MFANTYIHNVGTLVANYLRMRNNSMRLWVIWVVLTLNTNNLGTSMKPDIKKTLIFNTAILFIKTY